VGTDHGPDLATKTAVVYVAIHVANRLNSLFRRWYMPNSQF